MPYADPDKLRLYMREYCRERYRRKTKDPVWRKKQNVHQVGYCRRFPIKVLVQNAKARARERGTPFSITENDIVIPEFCPVLGIPLFKGCGARRDNSPSIDELIPGKGYTPENVRIISWRANDIKGNATAEELRKVADYISREIAKSA